MHITQVTGYVPLFRILETAGRIALKFGAWLTGPLAGRFYKSLGWGTVVRAHERTPLPYLWNGWTDCAKI